MHQYERRAVSKPLIPKVNDKAGLYRDKTRGRRCVACPEFIGRNVGCAKREEASRKQQAEEKKRRQCRKPVAALPRHVSGPPW